MMGLEVLDEERVADWIDRLTVAGKLREPKCREDFLRRMREVDRLIAEYLRKEQRGGG